MENKLTTQDGDPCKEQKPQKTKEEEKSTMRAVNRMAFVIMVIVNTLLILELCSVEIPWFESVGVFFDNCFIGLLIIGFFLSPVIIVCLLMSND